MSISLVSEAVFAHLGRAKSLTTGVIFILFFDHDRLPMILLILVREGCKLAKQLSLAEHLMSLKFSPLTADLFYVCI